MSLSKLYSKLQPKMGQYGEYYLPMTFNKYRTKDVVINTRSPGFATVFDVSHMGVFETFDRGLLEKKFMVNLSKLNNKSKLCGLINEKGHIIDDIIIGDVDNVKYRMVVNSNTKHIYRREPEFIETKKKILAIQGDYSQKLVESIFSINLNDIYFMDNKTIVDDELEICRCGYTGEDGFEIYMDENLGDYISNKLVDMAMENEKIMFGGLVERDLLRLEAGLCLSGNEFGGDMKVDFKALNMDFMVGINHRRDRDFKSYFERVGFSSKKPIKKGNILNAEGEIVGKITSSNKSFNLNKFIGMGYIKKGESNPEIENLPFIANKYRKFKKVF